MNINVNELWKRCIDIVFNNNQENFAKLKLKQYVQTNFKNYQNNRGICGLVSIYSSFKDYLNIDNDELSKLTKLPIDIRNDVEKLIEYFNEHYIIDDYRLVESKDTPYYRCVDILRDNIMHNQSVVMHFSEELTSSHTVGHGVSIYYIDDNDDTIGYIENAKNDYTFYVLALFWITYLGLGNDKDFIQIKELSIRPYELFQGRNDKYSILFDRFKNRFFKFENKILRKVPLKLFYPPSKRFDDLLIGCINLVTITKIKPQNFTLFDYLSDTDINRFYYSNKYIQPNNSWD